MMADFLSFVHRVDAFAAGVDLRSASVDEGIIYSGFRKEFAQARREGFGFLPFFAAPVAGVWRRRRCRRASSIEVGKHR
jgi:hypothetical protein